MTTSATQTGVQEQDNASADTTTATEEKREPTARELMMDQIDALNTQRLNDDLVKDGKPPILPDATTTSTEGAGEATTGATADQVAAQSEGDIFIDEAQLARYKVRTKIDGVEEVVPVAEMRLKYQKGGAADKRLDEATKLLREAREQADALKAAGQAPPIGSDVSQQNKDSTDQPSEAVQVAKKKLLKAMFEGDEVQALAALDEIVPAGRREPTPQFDANELTAKLVPQVKQQLVVESALEKFTKDHPDIVADPYLDQLTAGFIKEEMDGGKPFVEALEPAVKKTRDWLASKGVKKEAEPTPTMDRTTKLERKAGIDVIPALNTKATTTEEPEQSRSDVIAEMRKARGMEV